MTDYTEQEIDDLVAYLLREDIDSYELSSADTTLLIQALEYYKENQ